MKPRTHDEQLYWIIVSRHLVWNVIKFFGDMMKEKKQWEEAGRPTDHIYNTIKRLKKESAYEE